MQHHMSHHLPRKSKRKKLQSCKSTSLFVFFLFFRLYTSILGTTLLVDSIRLELLDGDGHVTNIC